MESSTCRAFVPALNWHPNLCLTLPEFIMYILNSVNFFYIRAQKSERIMYIGVEQGAEIFSYESKSIRCSNNGFFPLKECRTL
jgi:hypothetical protein